MLEAVDLQGTQGQSADLAGLRAYLQQVVGQPFLFVRFSYAEELTLHLGEARPYRAATMKDRVKGSYVLGARASSWYLRADLPPRLFFATPHERSSAQNNAQALTVELENETPIPPGARVLAAEPICISGQGQACLVFGCVLGFSQGSSLLIVPDTTPVSSADEGDEPNNEVADWELFTPYDRYLRVGPGPNWAYLPSRGTAVAGTTE